MLKVMSLLKRKEGMSFEEFKNWAQNEHPKLAEKIDLETAVSETAFPIADPPIVNR